MKHITRALLLFGVLLISGSAQAADGKVKVFILAGQSNMEGKGFPDPVAWQISQPKYRDRYKHFIKDGDFDSFTKKHQASIEADPKKPFYDWSEREDVWINYLGRHGNLTVGYAAPSRCFGPEYNFGHVVGDHFDEQVLLIKCAWGGKSLGRDFRSPSAGLPTDAEFEEMVKEKNAQITKNNEKNPDKQKPLVTVAGMKEPYGHFYREMMKEVHGTLDNLKERFPGYDGQGYELSGFVWFQGWNDQFTEDWYKSYGEYMACLISDVRKDLEAPDMKFVIGQVGFDGPRKSKPAKDGGLSARDHIKSGQLAMATRKGFKGSVAVVKTDQYWDMDADAIYNGPGGWSKDVDKWRQFGNDRPYHYLGSPWFFAQTGTGFGEAMVSLHKKK
jgi:alpha-galactosidase